MKARAHRTTLRKKRSFGGGWLLLGGFVAACATAPLPPPSTPEPAPAEAAAPRAAGAPTVEALVPPAPASAEPPPSQVFWKGRQAGGDLLDLPAAPEPARWAWPKEQVFSLPNGLTTRVLPLADEALVTVALSVPAGELNEPREARGASALLAGWLRAGSTRREGEPLELRVEELGATVSIESGRAGTVIACTAVQPAFGGCVALVADLATAPALDPKTLLAVRAQVANRVRDSLSQPGGRAGALLLNLIFGDDHPLGLPASPEDVGGLDQAAIRTFYETWFRPSLAQLVVAGNVQMPQVRAAVNGTFGAWTAKRSARAAPKPKATGEEGLRILLVDDPQAPVATVMFAGRARARAPQERAALEALVFSFGGAGLGSRLALDVATQGLISAGGATLEPAGAGEYIVRGTLQTSPEKAWPALLASAQQLKDLKEQGLSLVELLEAKARSAAFDPFALETGAQLALAVAGSEGRSLASVAAIADQVNRLDVRAIKTASRSLTPEKLAVVIVGPADRIGPELQRARVRFERARGDDPVSARERAQRRDLERDVASQDGSAARGLVMRALAAQGGAAAWRAVKTMKVVKRGKRREGGGIATIVSTTHYQRPGFVRVEQEAQAGRRLARGIFVVTPEEVRGSDGTQPLAALPEENVARLRAAVFEDVTFLLLNVLDEKPPLPMRLIEPLTEGDKRYPGLLLKVPSGQWLKLHFDPDTHLLARILAPDGSGGESEQRLSDWREVQGLRLPFKQISVGVNASGAELEQVEVNPPVDPSLFR